MTAPRAVLFRGCSPELAAGPDGRILGVGEGAAAAAGRSPVVHELRGIALPGLADAHVHLEWLAHKQLTVDLAGAPSREAALERVRRFAGALPQDAWVLGRGWYNDGWKNPAFPDRQDLDDAVGGRPAFLVRKDGHSAWVSSAALRRAGISAGGADPPGGSFDRDPDGAPTGIVRETAVDAVRKLVPEFTTAELDRGMQATLRAMLRAGITSVHSMDRVGAFASLERLHARRRLPLRVTFNLPAAELPHAERIGLRSGFGDEWLRIWGVKAFLDGSLGSRTAEMLAGGGTQVMPQPELVELTRRCAAAELNVCLHAIGDGAVRRALDALEPLTGAWSGWRPRIEHAQCVHEDDLPRFAGAGVIASMQPMHAVADRELADREWGRRTRLAYAWGALRKAGATLAFGSDAPVEAFSPLRGIEAATTWRRQVGWHPELAVSRADALRAYTRGAAYAVGMEAALGALRPGRLCDATVVEEGQVTATIVGGRLSRPRR